MSADTMSSEKPCVALVTGAASGMGRATAEAFLAQGWVVLAVDLTVADIPSTTGTLVPIALDVRDRDALEVSLTATVLQLGGEIHAVANVAGIYPPSTLETYTSEQFHLIFDVNVLGLLNVTAAALPYLPDGASVVNFASVDGYEVSPGQLLYGASKAAVIMITKSLALELAPRGIRVNAIAPGWVATPGTGATDRIKQAAAAIPLGRVAEPAEIAHWVWLLTGGGAASFMTGDTVTLSGGNTIR